MHTHTTHGTSHAGRVIHHLQEPLLGSALLSDQAWEEITRSLRLSGRELDIVQGVFDDKTELAIADDLGISPYTVHTHFDRLHRKLDVHDRAQMLLRVVQEYLRLTVSPDNDLPPVCPNRLNGLCPIEPQ